MDDVFKPARSNISKEPATIQKQLEKLKQRGLLINDAAYAGEVLTYINYYRLVHYFSVFLDESGVKKRYKAGTTFEMGLRLYDFDRRLRNLLLTALEEIEVSMRAVISNYHALKYGALGYLNASSFDRLHKHQVFLSKIDNMVEANKNEDFVSHYKNKHNNAFPLWVIMELFSFGSLYYFYLDMKQSDKKELAERHFPEEITSRHLDSWLECLSTLRNHCAHYNRLYANGLKICPRAYKDGEQDGSLFGYITVMKHLYKRPDSWRYGFVFVLNELLEEYGDVAEPCVLGFPEDWEIILG